MLCRSIVFVACFVAVLASGEHARGEATRFRIEAGPPNEVRFHSEATVESFDGTTDRVSGWVEVDPNALARGARWSVTVDMASLDTGIGLRNRHMRENHLHTDDHPTAVFEGEHDGIGWPDALPTGESVSLQLGGELDLHGVVRERTVDVTIERRADGSLAVQTSFPVALSDHDIPRPEFLVLKLADEQDVRLDLIATRPSEDR